MTLFGSLVITSSSVEHILLGQHEFHSQAMVIYLTQNEPPLITWGAKHGFASLTATRLKLLPIYITVLWSYDWKQPKCNVKVLFQSSGHSQCGSVTQKKKIVTSVLREKKPQILII